MVLSRLRSNATAEEEAKAVVDSKLYTMLDTLLATRLPTDPSASYPLVPLALCPLDPLLTSCLPASTPDSHLPVFLLLVPALVCFGSCYVGLVFGSLQRNHPLS